MTTSIRCSHHEREFVGLVKGAAAGDIRGMRHGKRRIDRIDAADEIMVLRRLHEWRELVAPQRHKDPAQSAPERGHRLRDIGDLGPAIAGKAQPRRPVEREVRNLRTLGRTHGIFRDRCRVGMRRIDQGVDACNSEIIGKPLGAAETAGAHRDRLRRGCGGAPGERERHGEVRARGKPRRKPPRLRRAAENEDASHGRC